MKKKKFQQLSKNNKRGGLNKERCGWKLFPKLISGAGRLLGTLEYGPNQLQIGPPNQNLIFVPQISFLEMPQKR